MPSAPAPEAKDPAPPAAPSPEPTGVAPPAEGAPPEGAHAPPDATPAAPDGSGPAAVPAPEPAPADAELGSRKETLKTLAIMLIAVAILGVVFAVSLGWEIPGLAGEKSPADKNQEAAPLKVDLVRDEKDPKKFVPHTLSVPEEVRVSLGIRKGKVDVVAIAGPPTTNQTLEFPGSTGFNPARIARIRVRFPTNGSEVVSIGKMLGAVSPTVFRELRPGDEVKAGQELATFYSVDVGSKKNDLIDAICQLKLDQEILDRALEALGAVPEVFVLNARRNVAGDHNTINRAIKTLETWNVPREDIEAIRKEAEEISKRGPAKGGARSEIDPDKERQWGKVVLKAPIKGVIIERNITANEIVVDNTINVFQIANVDELLVVVSVPEDLLPRLREIRDKEGLNWTIQTAGAPVKFRIEQKALDTLRAAGAPAGVLDKVAALRDREFATRTALEEELAKGLTREEREGWQKHITDAAKVGLFGPVDEIGYLIDPNTHTAVLKGFIKNENGALRAGQYVTAIIDLPREPNVVEVPMAAIIDDGRQYVFVQPDPDKPHYTLRRVKVTHRFDKVAFVASALTAADIALGNDEAKRGLLPFSPLKEGDRVLTSGILELKKELEDRESALATAKKP
jgi:cobalt-zinc-cadmium efflux system membrane fusion protein